MDPPKCHNCGETMLTYVHAITGEIFYMCESCGVEWP